MLDLFIKNAMVVDCDRVFRGSVGAKDGKTVLIADDGIQYEAAKTLDIEGDLLLPGAIDCHAHLNDPGFTWREDFPHGSKAAAVGGITTIIDMPLQNNPPLTTADTFCGKHRAITGKSAVDYCFWGGLIDNNISEIEETAKAGAVAFKAFISPATPEYTSADLGLVRRAMQLAAKLNLLLGFHCEDYAIIMREEALAKAESRNTRADFLCSRPLSAELIATSNILCLAKETGARVHICHVSHPDVAEMVRQAQREGISVTAETCPHYLLFNEQDFLDKGMLFKCAPPLRTAENLLRLWSYVADGTLSCVSSDHSPCNESEKSETNHGAFGAWGGISGIQSMVQVFYNLAVHKRGMSPCILAQRLSSGPAKAFGLYEKKGAVAPGFDADYCILDPHAEWEIKAEDLLYVNKISAYIGQKGVGRPVMTVLRGKIIVDNGCLLDDHTGVLVKKSL